MIVKWQLVNMGVDENRRFFVDHARAVWLWIVIADCLKRIKISGCAGGLPAILCFSIVPWKNTLPTCHAGRYAIISCANLLTQGPLHGMFLLLISKPAFYRWLNFAISWRLYNRRNGLPQRPDSPSHCFAEDVAMMKDCMLLRYQIYILTSCEFVDDLQMGVSIDFGNYGYALSRPVLFCSFPANQLSSPWYRCFCILALGLDC
jgi:hypothetical protein